MEYRHLGSDPGASRTTKRSFISEMHASPFVIQSFYLVVAH